MFLRTSFAFAFTFVFAFPFVLVLSLDDLVEPVDRVPPDLRDPVRLDLPGWRVHATRGHGTEAAGEGGYADGAQRVAATVQEARTEGRPGTQGALKEENEFHISNANVSLFVRSHLELVLQIFEGPGRVGKGEAVENGARS
jgi:hypothetical protein